MQKVLAAMSGGVDSSVSAYLLKEQGFEVAGVTMSLGIKESTLDDAKAIENAKKVAQKIDIPHYVMDFSEELEEKVVKPFISEYLRGRTPNPCIECNQHLKFGVLLEKAKTSGFDFLATGHYARIEKIDSKFLLKKARDKDKDQSYFLYPIKKENLKFIKFPLGDFTKEEVKTLARKIGLEPFQRLPSQDICFLSGRDYRDFLLANKVSLREGEILDLEGKILGRHKGIFFYTIGQREGLGISSGKPLYVVDINPCKNQLIVGEREALQARKLIACNLNLFVDNLADIVYAKIRYRHKEAECRVILEKGKAKVVFYNPQEAITPGQSIVFYNRDIVLGGGVIEEVVR